VNNFIKELKEKYSTRTLVFYMIIFSLLIITYAVTVVFFEFRDGQSLNVWSVEFWDVLAYKKLGDFYEYTQQNLRGAAHGVKDGGWLPIIPQIIWNFPIWLTHRNPATTDVTGSFCNAWGKMLYVFCFALLCVYVFKIAKLLTKDIEKSLIAVILTAGSMEAYASIAFAGQDEVIYMLALIIALYCRLKGRKTASLIWSAIAVTLCPLMIITIVAMELFYDKRIWSTIIKAVICMLPNIVFEFAYANDEIYQNVKSFNSIGIFQLMMNTGTIGTTVGTTCIPAILLIITFFFIYFTKESDDEVKVIADMGIIMVIMSFFMHTLFYRYWLYIPFVAIYIACTNGGVAIKVLLLLLTSVCRFLASFTYPDLYSYFYYSPIAKSIFLDAGEVINATDGACNNILLIAKPLSVACILLILFICYNKEKCDYKFPISEKVLIPIYLSSSSMFMFYLCYWIMIHCF